MPNWKKIIVSGSDASLNRLTVSTTGSFDMVEANTIDLDRLSLTSTQTTVPPLQLTANSLQDGVGALRIDGSQADIFLNPSTATHTTVTFAVNNDQRLAFGMDNNSNFYITRRTGGTWYDDTLVLNRNTGLMSLGYGLSVTGGITGSFTGSFTGLITSASHAEFADNSRDAVSASYSVSSSHAEFADNTRNAVSASYAVTASYAVSASVEIIKEVSSSYADTASIALSGDGIFSGSFSGSFEGDGSNLTGVGAFPYTGSAGISGSLNVTGDTTIIGSANFDVFSTPQTASGDSIIPDGYYAKMFGPVLVAGTVTVGTGSILKVEPF